jgi:hypothetical protein
MSIDMFNALEDIEEIVINTTAFTHHTHPNNFVDPERTSTGNTS